MDHESVEDDKMVAMKFMRQRTQFLREVRVRVLGNFSEEHVMGSVRVHDCDEDPDFKDEAITKGFERFPYCFVMHVGDRNLGDVMIKEHIAGRDWSQITMITTQIAAAVGHMHQNGFIHGDLKRKNELLHFSS
jgi:serine/threonine protein kinase